RHGDGDLARGRGSGPRRASFSTSAGRRDGSARRRSIGRPDGRRHRREGQLDLPAPERRLRDRLGQRARHHRAPRRRLLPVAPPMPSLIEDGDTILVVSPFLFRAVTLSKCRPSSPSTPPNPPSTPAFTG